jgi:two-component system, NtrC family, nitrogen regulation sensor histidine kinase NtrY
VRLRTTLAVAFLGLSLLQVATVVPVALRNLSALLQRQQDARIDQEMAAVDATVQRLGADVQRAMDELASSPALEDAARDAAKTPPPPALTSAAGSLMVPRGLSVLSLFDTEGRTLSSGHLPARLGDLDDALFAATRVKGTLVPVQVELRDETGLHTRPALVTSRALDYGDTRIWAVGGSLLDERVAQQLSRLTGARVEVWSGDKKLSTAGSAAPPTTLRTISWAPVAELRLHFSRADLIATREEVLRAFLALAALGLLLSVGVGFVLSRRVTRPVEALTDAARRIAAGELDVRVEERATGELKALVQTFNKMTVDLKATTDKLVASERIAAWQEVARRVAHEIKNPLTPIRMSLETLIAASDRDNPQFKSLFKESAVAVLEEVDRLKRIVDEFSQFARLPRPTLATVDLGELCRQVLALYAPHPIDGAGSPLITYVPKLEDGALVEADRDQLTQVVVNLIKNAEEAMTSSGKGGAVTLTVRGSNTEALIEVQDQGPGIPLELRARLFEPYVTTKPSGTGLGLAIASRIVQEHNGRLDAGGEPGQGAVFTIRLPKRTAR